MDLPYSQQQQTRRKTRSSANLQHLSLAPLTTRLPLRDDPDVLTDFLPTASTPSYLQGRSAPVTPRLLSKSPPPLSSSRSRSHDRNLPFSLLASQSFHGVHGVHDYSRSSLPKSLSTTHLADAAGRRSGKASPQQHHRRRRAHPSSAAASGDLFSLDSSSPSDDRSHSDWLLRAGAILTSETREVKGQSWLASRASSASLTGLHALDEEDRAAVSERELVRDRVAQYQYHYQQTVAGSIAGSHRGSWNPHTGDGDNDDFVVSAASPLRGSSLLCSHLGSHAGSRAGSRLVSRSASRTASRVQLFTMPTEDRQLLCDSGSYFEQVDALADLDSAVGPDFVNLDERLEALEQDTSLEDEDHVRRLVKREKAGSGVLGSWLGTVFGWPLFSVHEDDDDEHDDDSQKSDDEEEVEEEEDDDEEAINFDAYDSNDRGIEGEEGSPGSGGESLDRKSSRKSRRRRRLRPSAPRFFECDSAAVPDYVPPPPDADGGTWHDAAWLLSVASKVIL